MYNKINSDAKKYVTNYDKLQAAEKKFKEYSNQSSIMAIAILIQELKQHNGNYYLNIRNLNVIIESTPFEETSYYRLT